MRLHPSASEWPGGASFRALAAFRDFTEVCNIPESLHTFLQQELERAGLGLRNSRRERPVNVRTSLLKPR